MSTFKFEPFDYEDASSPLAEFHDDESSPASDEFSSAQDPSSGKTTKKGRRIIAGPAEQKERHNMIERQRRENLNGRFTDLAAALPNMGDVKRASKSAIVHKSLCFIADTKTREEALLKENSQLRDQIKALRAQLGMSPVPLAAPELPAYSMTSHRIPKKQQQAQAAAAAAAAAAAVTTASAKVAAPLPLPTQTMHRSDSFSASSNGSTSPRFGVTAAFPNMDLSYLSQLMTTTGQVAPQQHANNAFGIQFDSTPIAPNADVWQHWILQQQQAAAAAAAMQAHDSPATSVSSLNGSPSMGQATFFAPEVAPLYAPQPMVAAPVMPMDSYLFGMA